MSSGLLVVSVVPLVTSAAAVGIWTVRSAQPPRAHTGAASTPSQGVTPRSAAGAVTLAAAALVLLALSIRYGSGPVSFERSVEYTGLIFLVPSATWRAWRMLRPGRVALDRLATAAPAVTGGALLVAGWACGGSSSTCYALTVAGLLSLAGALLRTVTSPGRP